MSTPYSEVFERFSTKVKDYELDALFTLSEADYETYILNYLLSAIPKFMYDSVTDISKTARNDTTKVFTNDLKELEVEILACMMVEEHIGREVRKLEDMRRVLGDHDFKLTSGANSLRENKDLLITIKEDINALVTDFSWREADIEGDL
jgi:hypothetical protein